MRGVSRILPFLLALAAGWVQAAAIATPWSGEPSWWLQLFSLALLAGLLQHEVTVGRGALFAWLFAIAWLAGTFWWLFISMHVYGGLSSVLAAAAVLLLAMFLAAYYAAACAIHVRLAGASRVMNALLFGALWLGAELARVSWFTGFPWGESGYAHVDGPLGWLAPFVGVHGISFVAAVIAALLAPLVDYRRPRCRREWLVLAAAAVLVALPVPQSVAPIDPARPRLSVALLQGNIPQDEKFQAGSGIPVALGWYREQLAQSRATLTVTPETAIPLLPYQLPEGYLRELGERFGHGEQAALVGIPLGSFSEGYTNSVLGLKPGAEPYRYDKHHLVPFGEFIPPLFKWFTRMMNIPLGDFNRGLLAQPSFEWQGERLAPNICYEDLFGEELASRFADEAHAPTVFVNMSNIGWFGNTIAIDQHLAISRMRAIEFERPVLRATNTGATAIIDARGHLTRMLPRATRGVLTGEVQGGQGITPYAWWAARLGLWPLWGFAAIVLAFAALAARAASRRRP